MRREYIILGVLIGATLLAHLATATRYPMFRDEFYYLECANHVDWGYVDQPPLSIVALAAWRAMAGDSLFAVRVLPAVAAALLMGLIWKITADLGGGLFARVLAVITSFFATQQRAIFGFYSMNAFDLILWAALFWFVIRILKTDNSRLWIPFGILAGLGLMNKIGLLLFGAGLIVAMLLTPLRKHFRRWQFWIGGMLAVLIFSPYVVWQFSHDFATLEFMHNAAAGKNVALSPFGFLGMVTLENNPASLIVWGLGLIALLLSPALRPHRALGWLALSVLVILMAQNSKPYYAAGVMPVLFAAGARAVEYYLAVPRWRWARIAVVGLMVVSGLTLLPFGLRVLSPDQFVDYQSALGGTPPASERGHVGEAIPQIYGDSFGWIEMTRAVAGVYHSLKAEEQQDCVIIGRNYGEAGALNYYGRSYELPHAYTPHNNGYFWGPPPVTESTSCILIQGADDDPSQCCDSIRLAATHDHPLAVPEERYVKIYVVSRPKAPIAELWRAAKNFD